jgi:hypothetical protein
MGCRHTYKIEMFADQVMMVLHSCKHFGRWIDVRMMMYAKGDAQHEREHFTPSNGMREQENDTKQE